ncbi:CoA pyrophosphatase [Georgenia sp. TF02-10]|uniref:NUDIX hydrolase n=1 Tax=Georgenia sp. TF02-10 TaxID=2917725 RepID=UPI001FA75999|nr:CoA pyrophosphatase [Georgenia sp. TF02-10]UNX54290.1 CoA pyrophosphatase [Georgenia sp. TF02-10]
MVGQRGADGQGPGRPAVGAPDVVARDAPAAPATAAPDPAARTNPATHPARADLQALADRSRTGSVAALGGLHRDDAATTATYRRAAVLILLTPGTGPDPGVDLFLVQRGVHLRQHPGEIALPGGGLEPGDTGPAAAALREAQEETGLDPGRVEVLGALPPAAVPVSRNLVTPVLGWADDVGPLTAVQPGEVVQTIRVAVAALLDPAARASVRILSRTSAGFRIPTGWVWGFTGNLLDHVFTELGWTRPWDPSQEVVFRFDPVHQRVLAP